MRYLLAISVRLLLAILPLALFPMRGIAQSGAGTTSAVILQISPAPRPLALGGAYSAIGDDELSIFYNPARLSISERGFGLAYQRLPAGASTGALAGVRHLGPGTLGLGLQYLNFGEIDLIEPDPTTGGEVGIPTGERVGGGEAVLSAGYGVEPISRLQLGAAARLLHLQLAGSSTVGTALDLGIAYELPGEMVTIAGSVQNLGPETGPGRKAPLPRTLRGGTSIRIVHGTPARVELALEAIHREESTSLASGAEIGVDLSDGVGITGRVGYTNLERGGAAAPFTVGVGLGIERYRVDYAFRDLGPLGTVHLFGIAVRSSGH